MKWISPMKISKLLPVAITTIAMTCATFAWPQAPAITFTDFSLPLGGDITGINNAGSVIGYSVTSASTNGFVWNGAILKTFQAPHASVTKAMGVNRAGWIVGYASDHSASSGFLLNTKYTIISVPASTATFPTSINDAGQISGTYLDASSVEHGFIRDASGNYTTFDVSGGTILNVLLGQNGEIAGSYTDASSAVHGYMRDTSGNITVFDAQLGGYTYVYGINATGEIAGTSALTAAFVRGSSGNITLIDVPGLTYTGVIGIGDNGTVYGKRAVSGVDRIWEYTAGGDLTYIVHPDAGYIGTIPACVSGNGKVAGVYYDTKSVEIGFELRQ